MNTAAGWYPDPEMAHTQRYWDGGAWTDDRAPATATATATANTAAPASTAQTTSAALDLLGIATAIFIPIVGLVIGLALIGKSKAATSILVISVISFVLYALILTQN